MVVTALYDNSAARFLDLVVKFTNVEAIRDFKLEMQIAFGDTSNRLYLNHDDIDLYHLADFDSETGVLMPINPTCICKGSQAYNEEYERRNNG